MSFAYITEKGAIITHKNGRFIVGRNHETLLEIPQETFGGTRID